MTTSGRAGANQHDVNPVRIPYYRLTWVRYASLAAILLILIGFWTYSESLISTIQSQSVQIVQLRGELRQREELLNVLSAPRIDMVLMIGTGPSPAAFGKIIWDPEKKAAILQIANIPPPPQDKDYQLWVMKNKKWFSVGVCAVTSEEEQRNVWKVMGLDAGRPTEIDAFAVTLEPKGGLSRPSGRTYLMGNAQRP